MRFWWIASVLLSLLGVQEIGAKAVPDEWVDCSKYPSVDGSKMRHAPDLQNLSDRNDGKMVTVFNLKLPGQNLSGLNLSNLCFVRPDFAKTNWSGAEGQDLLFDQANLEGSEWKAYHGEGLAFLNSNLKNAIFARGRFRSTRFQNSTVENMDARHADLSNSSFSGNWSSYLTKAKFDNANMTGFQLSCGMVDDICGQYSKNISFRSANFTNASLSIPFMEGLDFSNVTLKNTSVPLHLSRYLRDANVEGTVIITPAPWNAMPLNALSAGRYEFTLSASDFRQLANGVHQLHISSEQPSFDCRKAQTKAEIFICDVRPYSYATRFADQDTELQRAYDTVRRSNPALVTSQRQWLKDRDTCLDQWTEEYERESCFRDKYHKRTEMLWNMVEPNVNLAVGEKMIFVSAADYMSTTFTSTKLFRKMAATVAVNSWNYVVVERKANGRLSADGNAVGANGQVGSILSPEQGLVFDKKSGCFGAFEKAGEGEGSSDKFYPIIRIRGDRLEEGNSCSADPTPDYNDYIVLGARAHFSPMRRLPLTTKQIDEITVGRNS